MSNGTGADVLQNTRAAEGKKTTSLAEMRAEIADVNRSVQRLAGQQQTTTSQLERGERKATRISSTKSTAESNVNKVEAELQAILSRMDAGHKCPNAEDVVQVSSQNRRLAETVEKLSLKVSGIDQVQSSTLQLFEALERLEERYDENIGELQREVLAVFNQSRSQAEQERRLASLEQQKESLARMMKDMPHDCREVGSSSSGANLILPRGSDEPIKVYCDQETSGGGWTVIQRRTDGKEDFNRNWAAYKSGFGSVHGEFWLGNDHLHQLTKDNTTILRVDLWDIYGQYWWAEYDSFLVSDERSGYTVQFHGYTGNASDAMASYHQSMKFSTRDNDQDLSNTNCADSYQGGWWYSHCQHVNINGKYALGLTWYDSLENEWIALARVEMKLRDKRIFSSSSLTLA
uniref:EOG090X02LG n=1 Tax=Alona affinis TaxID=381656 RepID=A0A9N6WRT7_9CRUS|nr:EOG090X02LG [Alona affinis]